MVHHGLDGPILSFLLFIFLLITGIHFMYHLMRETWFMTFGGGYEFFTFRLTILILGGISFFVASLVVVLHTDYFFNLPDGWNVRLGWVGVALSGAITNRLLAMNMKRR